ncbi:hypothetical protein [Streptomyces sp. URMC 123]|uniref:hypothetical protein n=1 Tax=Streptomyces sp. URMC 123 TaxID=3423403 RepID=UPI003F1C147B
MSLSRPTPGPACPPPPEAGARLVAADHVAGVVQVFEPHGGRLLARLEGRHLSEHAGFLRLPGGRLAFVDDLAGEVVLLDPFAAGAGRPLVSATVPVAVPAEHLATDPSGRFLAVSTGCGPHAEPWSDLLTVVDLTPDGGGPPRAVRVRTRVGEPGVAFLGAYGSGERGHERGYGAGHGYGHEHGYGAGEARASARTDAAGSPPLLVMRHRMPGSLGAYRLDALFRAGPGCPLVEPCDTLPLPDDGHGDAVDPLTGRLFTATEDGVRTAVRAGAGRLAAGPGLPWDACGRAGGRGYYLRPDPAHRTLWSTVRGGPADPGRWPEWTNDAWWHRLDEGRTGRLPLGPGLVFRLALTADRAAFTRIHPRGDELVLVDSAFADARGVPQVTARIPLPAMDGAPREGGTPWDGVQRRAVAASPGADLLAVTRGGHGEIHLIGATTARVLRTLRTDGALHEGGHLALVTRGDGGSGDTVGR